LEIGKTAKGYEAVVLFDIWSHKAWQGFTGLDEATGAIKATKAIIV
jgi:hypothetical protein